MANIRTKLTLLLTAGIIVAAVGCASHPLEISRQVRVPGEFRTNPPGWRSPTGEPESVRYTKSYEAFWWNCVMVKAEDFENRCPFTCSGTPAATYGCAEGAEDAERQIRQLLGDNGATKVRKYLQSIAADPRGKVKIRTYFPNGPRTEKVAE
jgi:hypothetical protein